MRSSAGSVLYIPIPGNTCQIVNIVSYSYIIQIRNISALAVRSR